jgi:N-carbamoylputrescine amidase
MGKSIKIGLAQLKLTDSLKTNHQKALQAIKEAGLKGADIITFPEVHLTKFFPQHEKQEVKDLAVTLDSGYVIDLKNASKEAKIWSFPNVYLNIDNKYYDATLVINDNGELVGVSKMVHILQATQFYEEDYYTPSEEGIVSYDTPWGKIGVVICFDRHIPESFRLAALQGAFLVVVPTANAKNENLEMFEWEIRVAAMQNNIFIAMTNRVGLEDEMYFAGQSLLVDPNGDVITILDDQEQISVVEIDVDYHDFWRKNRPYITKIRPSLYKKQLESLDIELDK